MKRNTVGDAFGIAIAAEHAAGALYRGLKEKFAAYDDLAPLWHRLARDEADHAEWLANMRARLPADHLARRVDAETVTLLQAVQDISIEKALAGIETLDDACRTVDEIENGETNAIFQFLLNNFEMDLHLRAFLRRQLDEHVAMLDIQLPIRYKTGEARKEVRVLP